MQKTLSDSRPGFYLVWLILVLTGCATMDSVENSDDREAVSRVFPQRFEQVSSATLESMQNLNINIKNTERKDGEFEILFTKSMSAWSWGEVGKVTVRSLADGATIVLVTTSARHKGNVTATSEDEFASAIYAGIDQILK